MFDPNEIKIAKMAIFYYTDDNKLVAVDIFGPSKGFDFEDKRKPVEERKFLNKDKKYCARVEVIITTTGNVVISTSDCGGYDCVLLPLEDAMKWVSENKF